MATESLGMHDVVVAPFIEGLLAHSDSSLIDVINPSNGRRCLCIPRGSGADVDRAVRSARHAFDDGRWSDIPPSFRKRALHRLAAAVAAEGRILDALDAGEMGKPVRETIASAEGAAALLEFCAESVDKIAGDVYASDKRSFVAQRWVPRGVVGAIVPWNFPTYNAVLKIAPALAAGNTVVLKPSELSSRSAMKLAQLAIDAGIPPGVLNVVPGAGETVGRALGLHVGVDMLSFTGSTEVGQLMLQYAGQSNLKVVLTECGGKSPQIVFSDGVDLDAAAASIARSLLTNQGQICSVGSRLLVHRSIESAMVERITTMLGDIVMGDALDPRTTFGPLASEKQCSRVMSYIEGAFNEGARLIMGGRRALRDSGGFFVEPTMFQTRADSTIAREEIFGPVLAMIPFDDEADAIRIANATSYGLIAYVWTADLSTGMRMAKGIRSSVFINSAAPSSEGAGHAACWEPYGHSGTGAEGGIGGVQSYQRRQVVWVNHG